MGYVNGLHYLGNVANQQAKQAARAQAEADAAKALADKQAAKAAKRAAAAEAERQASLDPWAALLGFEVPKKIAGIPTWMVMAGGLIAGMYILGGSSKRR